MENKRKEKWSLKYIMFRWNYAKKTLTFGRKLVVFFLVGYKKRLPFGERGTSYWQVTSQKFYNFSKNWIPYL